MLQRRFGTTLSNIPSPSLTKANTARCSSPSTLTQKNLNHLRQHIQTSDADYQIVVGWMQNKQRYLGLSPQTFFAAVRLFVKCLIKRKRTKKQTAVAGAAALFMSSKIVQVYNQPVLRDILQGELNDLSEYEVIMEQSLMLEELNFKVTGLTPYNYLHQLKEQLGFCQRTLDNCVMMLRASCFSVSYGQFDQQQLALAVVSLCTETLVDKKAERAAKVVLLNCWRLGE